MCRNEGFPSFSDFLTNHLPTLLPAGKKKKNEYYPDVSDVSSTGEAEQGMQMASTASLMRSLLSTLGWSLGCPFYSRGTKAMGDQGKSVLRAGSKLHPSA